MNKQLNKRPLAVAIMGPTASGKTASALRIAERVPAEIISVDSALVYRDMDIGTAKPTRDELAAVPHHLIDIIDPLESYSVAQFRSDTLRLVEEITSRGKLPLLVGGTMLYYKGLNDGLDDLPGADPAIRAQLDAEAARDGWPALHARLATLDPETAARLKPMDSQRIQRALEVIALSGKPMSELFAQQVKKELPFDLASFALEPSDRAVLHARIERRFDIMLEGGLLDEVKALRERGDLHVGLPSIRCVGYRQAWQYLDGEIDYKTMRDTGIFATRQLCKRQLTWLRSMPGRTVIDCLAPDAAEQLMQQVLARMATN
jgi:tRNA dimethylallyltransferase